MALLLATAGDIAPKVLGLLLTTVGQGLFHQGPRIVRNLYKRIPHPALTDACFPSETATHSVGSVTARITVGALFR